MADISLESFARSVGAAIDAYLMLHGQTHLDSHELVAFCDEIVRRFPSAQQERVRDLLKRSYGNEVAG